MRFKTSRTNIGLGDAVDVRPVLEKAALGGTLDTQELLNVAATQRTAHLAKSTLSRPGSPMPKLSRLVGALTELHPVVTEISRSIDHRGEVLDSASLPFI